MKIVERELHAANVLFEPPLYEKTKKSRLIFLHPPSGKIYLCGWVKGQRIYLSRTATLENIPEVEKREVLLSDKTWTIILAEVRKRLCCPLP